VEVANRTPDVAPGTVLYARFGARLRAMLVDLATLMGAFVLVVIAIDVVGSDTLSNLLLPSLIATFLLYDPLMVSRLGGTIGHRSANLRVVDTQSGLRVGILRAFVRFVLKTGLGAPSFVFMAMTRRHQALHDVITRSVVVIHSQTHARRHDYVLESDFEPPPSDVSILRRSLAVITYSTGLFVALVVPVVLLVSEECMINYVCSATEDTFSNIAGLTLILGIGGITVLGWRGKLYGARGHRLIKSAVVASVEE
jgi:uncharacterized RDD family membrane protein YckC